MTAARLFKPDEIVDNEPEKIHARKIPGKPFLSLRTSMTKYGKI